MARRRARSSAGSNRPTSRPKARRPARPVERPVVPGSVPADARYPPSLTEAPHAHAVCRSCGRITEVELQTEEHQLLRTLAEQHPLGWSIDGVTFSLTGTCPRCRGLVSELAGE